MGRRASFDFKWRSAPTIHSDFESTHHQPHHLMHARTDDGAVAAAAATAFVLAPTTIHRSPRSRRHRRRIQTQHDDDRPALAPRPVVRAVPVGRRLLLGGDRLPASAGVRGGGRGCAGRASMLCACGCMCSAGVDWNWSKSIDRSIRSTSLIPSLFPTITAWRRRQRRLHPGPARRHARGKFRPLTLLLPCLSLPSPLILIDARTHICTHNSCWSGRCSPRPAPTSATPW